MREAERTCFWGHVPHRLEPKAWHEDRPRALAGCIATTSRRPSVPIENLPANEQRSPDMGCRVRHPNILTSREHAINATANSHLTNIAPRAVEAIRLSRQSGSVCQSGSSCAIVIILTYAIVRPTWNIVLSQRRTVRRHHERSRRRRDRVLSPAGICRATRPVAGAAIGPPDRLESVAPRRASGASLGRRRTGVTGSRGISRLRADRRFTRSGRGTDRPRFHLLGRARYL